MFVVRLSDVKHGLEHLGVPTKDAAMDLESHPSVLDIGEQDNVSVVEPRIPSLVSCNPVGSSDIFHSLDTSRGSDGTRLASGWSSCVDETSKRPSAPLRSPSPRPFTSLKQHLPKHGLPLVYRLGIAARCRGHRLNICGRNPEPPRTSARPYPSHLRPGSFHL